MLIYLHIKAIILIRCRLLLPPPNPSPFGANNMDVFIFPIVMYTVQAKERKFHLLENAQVILAD
jgi:hypothetical protein